jgi:hypothetical protein
MVQCVGCHQKLKNGKAYSNHRRACKKYKAAGALRLQQMQLNRAKKVERAQAQAFPIQVGGDEGPKGLVIHNEDFNHELVVRYFLQCIL